MPTPFHFKCNLPLPIDLMWRVRASPTFMTHLVSTGALNRMDATSAKSNPAHSPTSFSRVQTYVPGNIQIPDIVKPIFDDSYLELTDTQTWDDDVPYFQTFSIRPGVLSEIITSKGELRLEEADGSHEMEEGDWCAHVISGSCEVAVPLVGCYAEQAIVDNMQTFYDSYPKHVALFVQSVVNRFGDGEKGSVRQAVDKMLAEEKEAEI